MARSAHWMPSAGSTRLMGESSVCLVAELIAIGPVPRRPGRLHVRGPHDAARGCRGRRYDRGAPSALEPFLEALAVLAIPTRGRLHCLRGPSPHRRPARLWPCSPPHHREPHPAQVFIPGALGELVPLRLAQLLVGVHLVEDLLKGGTAPSGGGGQPVWLSCPAGIGGILARSERSAGDNDIRPRTLSGRRSLSPCQHPLPAGEPPVRGVTYRSRSRSKRWN